jgi:hypothetical protein
MFNRCDISNLENLTEEYAEYGHRDIFDYVRNPNDKVLREIYYLDVETKNLENAQQHIATNVLIYTRRLVAGIVFKRNGDKLDAAYSLDRSGKHAAFVARDADKNKNLWNKRAATLRKYAASLFLNLDKKIDYSYSIGHAGINYIYAGFDEKGKKLLRESKKSFNQLGITPQSTLNCYFVDLI